MIGIQLNFLLDLDTLVYNCNDDYANISYILNIQTEE